MSDDSLEHIDSFKIPIRALWFCLICGVALIVAGFLGYESPWSFILGAFFLVLAPFTWLYDRPRN